MEIEWRWAEGQNGQRVEGFQRKKDTHRICMNEEYIQAFNTGAIHSG